MNKSIDINCDLGESFGNYKVGNDDAVFPFLSSCNIACGFHGGDPLHIKNTIAKAIEHKVQIGAHPSYPDKLGFGRNKMHIQGDQLRAIIEYQVATLKSMTESQGAILKYVKPHGALYNSISKDLEEAKYVIDGILTIDENLIIMVLAGSPLQQYMASQNLKYVPEAFADRRYESDGTLSSRKKAGAVIHDSVMAAEQVYNIAANQKVTSADDQEIDVIAKSICIHGDNHAATDIATAIHKKLNEANIEIKAFE